MWVIFHHQQVLHTAVRCQTLVSYDEACYVVVLQQGDSVNGSLVHKVLTVCVAKDFYCDWTLI